MIKNESTHDDQNIFSPIERDYSYIINIIGKKLPKDVRGLEGERRGEEQGSLCDTVTKIFGISYREKSMIGELHYLSKYSDIVDEMNRQKAFTIKYIAMLVKKDPTDRTLRNIMTILLKHEILNILNIPGESYRSFGLNVYYAMNAKQKDILDSAYEYVMQDRLRHLKDLQRREQKKHPKGTAKEVVEHNTEVQRLSREAKKDNLTRQDEAKIILAAGDLQDHKQAFDDEKERAELHHRTCTSCQRSEVLEEPNNCHDYHILRSRSKDLGKTLLKTIARYPDHINEPALLNQVNDDIFLIEQSEQEEKLIE